MNTRYIMLMSSLPYLGNLFAVKQPAISQARLKSRLELLEEKDQVALQRITTLIGWSQEFPERTDAQFIAEARGFLKETHSSTLRELLGRHFAIGTIMAAFRRRNRGESEPPRGELWGLGRWVPYIERHWAAPDFHLEAMFPWVPAAGRLFRANDLAALDRLLAGIKWKMLERLSAGHEFDFEAVVIYIGRWELVNHCCGYSSEGAVERFRKLVASGVKEYRDLFGEAQG